MRKVYYFAPVTRLINDTLFAHIVNGFGDFLRGQRIRGPLVPKLEHHVNIITTPLRREKKSFGQTILYTLASLLSVIYS